MGIIYAEYYYVFHHGHCRNASAVKQQASHVILR